MADGLIVKVGGSLFARRDLRDLLVVWLARHTDESPLLLVPGGGKLADVIRTLDRVHRLGDESAHWLAIRTMQVNAYFLADLLGIPIVATVPCPPLAVVDVLPWLQADERCPDALPHNWQVTSDAIAVRISRLLDIRRVVFLKSCAVPAHLDAETAAQMGILDSLVPDLLRDPAITYSIEQMTATPPP
jgi:aspartokinase-like uncharacterized kinase